MDIECPKCHTKNTSDSKFCKKCATPLPGAEGISASPTKTLETPVEELQKGTAFPKRYEFIEELGKGGMGKVYKVFDKRVKEEIALKLLKPEISDDEQIIERFSNELKFSRKIVHKNVCRMYDINEEEGKYFITMEFVPGEDLRNLIEREGQLPIEKAVFIGRQICKGLFEAHRLGVIHRDLKPSNIMIDMEKNARIMDFGIARSLKARGITGEGVMIGTPEYISPEQVEGKKADQRSDIYSLGVILYRMLTGKVPFEGDTTLSIALKHKTEIPKDPRELNDQIPENLSRMILKCMEKKKEDRYQTAHELLNDLKQLKLGDAKAKKRGKLHKLLFTPIIKTRKKKRIKYKKIFSKLLKYSLRVLIVLLIIYGIISAISLINDAIYKEKLMQIRVERDIYYKNLYPIQKDWLPEEWEIQNCNACNTYMKLFPSETDKNYYVMPWATRRPLDKVYEDFEYDIEGLKNVIKTHNKDFKLDELFDAVRCSKLNSYQNIESEGIYNPINVIQYVKMIVVSSRLDFLEGNYEKGLEKIHDALIFSLDIMLSSNTLIEGLVASSCFKMLYKELVPILLSDKIDYNQNILKQLEERISIAIEKFESELIYYREYLWFGTILKEKFFGYWWVQDALRVNRFQYYLYGKLYFLFNGFSSNRSIYKAADYYKNLFEELRYIQNIRNKGIYIKDYHKRNINPKNVACRLLVPDLTLPHFKFSISRTFGKLVLIILYMNKYGMNSLEFSDLKGTDVFINELSGKKFEIISEGEESFIVLDEKYKLNLKKIDYQKHHKEILKSFKHFDIKSMDQIRSLFYSFELE